MKKFGLFIISLVFICPDVFSQAPRFGYDIGFSLNQLNDGTHEHTLKLAYSAFL